MALGNSSQCFKTSEHHEPIHPMTQFHYWLALAQNSQQYLGTNTEIVNTGGKRKTSSYLSDEPDGSGL